MRMARFVRTLLDVPSGRLLWATDWPHTTLTRRMLNDGDLVDLLEDWIPTPACARRSSSRTRQDCIGSEEAKCRHDPSLLREVVSQSNMRAIS